MDLVLSVLADPEGANMLKHTKLFTPDGGSIGRADSNDWVLPDPERVVSSQHAQIAFNENRYFLTDLSTNGTYHNQSSDPIGKGNRVPLNDGDTVTAGDYQLKVSIRRPQADSGLPKGVGEADFLDSSDRTTFSPAAAAKMQNREEARQLDSWLEPGAGGGADTGEWGYVAGAAQSADSVDSFLGGEQGAADPLAAFDGGPGAGRDPLSGFGSPQSPAVSNWDDDDWWKDGSEQDHAPADSHSMQFAPQQQPQAPVTEPAAPQPPPAAPPPQQPQPAPQVQAPQQPPADNPFADSFAAMEGQQVEGAPGFDTGAQPAPSTGPGFSGASQQFSPLQPQQPPAPQPAQAPPQQPATPPPQPSPPPSQPAAAPPQPAVPPQGEPQPHPQAAPPQSGPAPAANALAAGLGLKLSPEQLQQLDQQTAAIVEESVTRLIDLLRARTSIKNELRVQRTMIQTEANNPLKFSANARDALNAMFAGNGAFMAPQQAVRDSFDDLSDHQVAVLAGMRAGYDAMLKFFNPDNIERRAGNAGGVFASRSAKNWEGFVEMYRELMRDPEACYRRLFGEEFAETYESQLAELKNARSLNQQR
ncbi:type VI secretion system-associated FHA domain protein TagH [Microbulbifer halophilus]|uniref:Type VI secretion system-associated FHA domain protein TagH n=1 Tax=Microbulbifer halophilus TaxID=453963 RepID=A0ABW5ECE2_9GAMM|nr:type VI secretion system-associated FHA domain protein TagH [Microbulbifer halophilus]MCW8128135.1 type VI secretion system-associated FHA domain protein TagH [Microbulbifer halophilus]